MVIKPKESISRELQYSEPCCIDNMYEQGLAALPDYGKAIYFFGLAAEKGCAEAQRVLSYWGLKGECRSGLPGI